MSACLEERFDETIDGWCGDIESQSGEDEGCCEAAGAQLIGEDLNETSELVQAEDYMSFVGEISIVVTRVLLFPFLCIDLRRVQVQRQEASVRYLEVTLRLLIWDRTESPRSRSLFSFVLFTRCVESYC